MGTIKLFTLLLLDFSECNKLHFPKFADRFVRKMTE